ncbi:hypothetical protein [Shimia thalassica]|uniref:hypothetical protein n=1 Tax=Shimia thalassica TaxID=1715693 RepID=UPI0026E47651|nr:hypothetical protein [Shimia thalassica]MDO6478503.1 hypothetical protein [Shimia thalassica]
MHTFVAFSLKNAVLSVFLTLVILVNPIAAEVFNRDGVFNDVEVCSGYITFLEGNGSVDGNECHRLAAFLIENQHLELTDFLTEIANLAGTETTLGALARTLLATVSKDAELAYTWSELAGRRVAIKMAQSADTERAAFYAHLLSEVQRRSVVAMCKPEANCESLEPLTSVKELVGDRFGNLDDLRADFVLLCLLRTDAYLIPLRGVLESRALRQCIQRHS